MFAQMSSTPAVTRQTAKPKLGMRVAFRPGTEDGLASIPANVVHIWPRFPSGDYLVTLEYAQPVKVGQVFLRQMDAFVSELYQPTPATAPTLH